jgi:hypothetical protein
MVSNLQGLSVTEKGGFMTGILMIKISVMTGKLVMHLPSCLRFSLPLQRLDFRCICILSRRSFKMSNRISIEFQFSA